MRSLLSYLPVSCTPLHNFRDGLPFTTFVGTVSERNREKKQVTVVISYWGKPTPFVFDFRQVEKIDLF